MIDYVLANLTTMTTYCSFWLRLREEQLVPSAVLDLAAKADPLFTALHIYPCCMQMLWPTVLQALHSS